MAVWVDSAHVGTIFAGEGVTLTVTPGAHRVVCDLQHVMTREAGKEFVVPPGKHLVVLVAPGRMTGAISFSSELA